MERTKELLNEVLVEVFNQIMFNEEKNLIKDVGKDITIRDIHVIEEIAKNVKLGNSASNIVAKSLNITAGTLTTAIKRLESKGYVVRKSDEKDKRFSKLFLTEKGEKVNKLHMAFHKKMVDKILQNVTIEEEKLLIDLLSKVIDFFK